MCMGVAVASRDQALIEQCLEGRIDAFGELVAPYQDRLYNTLFRLLGNPDDAAELLQDAMVQAFRGLKSFHGDASFYTWLYRITLNVAFANQRKQRLRLVRAQESTAISRLDLPDPNERNRPEEGIEREERHRLIQQALGEVPETFRVILVLKDIEGMKYEEISEVLDIPIGTVRSRLHRARCELKDKLLPLMERGDL